VDARGAAVLDIGDDVGALVLDAPEALLGHEVELEPEGDRSRRVHTVVREQRVGPVRRFAAVFPALRAGRYRICAGHGAGPVMVAGGAVTQADWPSTA